jgi:hypothetical protein
MVPYVIFIKERTHYQGDSVSTRRWLPPLAGHPITFRIAQGHKEVVEGPDFEGMMWISNLSGGESLLV